MTPPRLDPERPLPPYGYVPRRTPHPVRHPDGHRYGLGEPDHGAAPEAARGRGAGAWLHGLDLFNHGYYWEAHEAFEAWWKATPRGDARRPLFHALVRLSAAGVKSREASAHGVASHGAAAARLLREAARLAGPGVRVLGLDPGRLAGEADAIAGRAPLVPAEPGEPARPVLPVCLVPE